MENIAIQKNDLLVNAQEIGEQVADIMFDKRQEDGSYSPNHNMYGAYGYYGSGTSARSARVNVLSEGDMNEVFVVVFIIPGNGGKGFRFTVFADEATPERVIRFTEFYKEQMMKK